MVRTLYTASEQAVAPTCGVCGRKLGVGFYFSCHVCGATYCYAHSPVKCNHAKAKASVPQTRISR